MNTNNIINCEEIAQQIKDEIKLEVKSLAKKPKLCVIQVGNNQASNSYIKGKKKDCFEVGIDCGHIQYHDKIAQNRLIDIINILNKNNTVNGIIVQLPLPKHIDVNAVINAISPLKDVDGFRSDSHFIPCTPKGIMSIIDDTGINIEGKNCVVIGRSDIVGKPIAKLLLDRNATVTMCHSRTKDLNQHSKNADIIICAVGKEKILTKDMVKDNAIVIDVGINRNEQGKLCGDIDKDISDKAIITPVPKGVGLMTRVSLLENTLEAYKLQIGVICEHIQLPNSCSQENLEELKQKQIPKKIIRWGYRSNSGVCPSCQENISRYPYCPLCGQKLDWSVIDEM